MLPQAVEAIIQRYSELPLGGKKVACPYFINAQRKRDLRALVGKGTPEEIVMEANILAKIKGFDMNSSSGEQIRDFLIQRGIGIDCSGFVAHVIDGLYWQRHRKHIWPLIKLEHKGVFARLRYWVRSVEKLGAELMTNDENSTNIELKNVQILDLIRSKAKKTNGHHIMLVTDVERDANGNPTKIEYTHSTPHYGKLNGVKQGYIEITDLNKPLEEQNWLEVDEYGVNHTLEGYLQNPEDNGIRRLRFSLD